MGLENKKGWGGEEGHLEYGYGMGCDVRDVAQRNRVIANSLEETEVGGKVHTALSGDGTHRVHRNFTGRGDDVLWCGYGSTCAAH